MKPCDNCSVIETCKIFSFISKSSQLSPWEIDKRLSNEFFGTSIIFAISGNLDKFVLECSLYSPIKRETDYSGLKKQYNNPSSKCGSGGCGGCKC